MGFGEDWVLFYTIAINVNYFLGYFNSRLQSEGLYRIKEIGMAIKGAKRGNLLVKPVSVLRMISPSWIPRNYNLQRLGRLMIS